MMLTKRSERHEKHMFCKILIENVSTQLLWSIKSKTNYSSNPSFIILGDELLFVSNLALKRSSKDLRTRWHPDGASNLRLERGLAKVFVRNNGGAIHFPTHAEKCFTFSVRAFNVYKMFSSGFSGWFFQTFFLLGFKLLCRPKIKIQ